MQEMESLHANKVRSFEIRASENCNAEWSEITSNECISEWTTQRRSLYETA